MPAPSPAPLADAFLDAVDPAVRGSYAGFTGLEAALHALVDAAGGEEHRGFVAEVARRIDPELPPERALATVRAGELALALACARGEPAALARFEAEHFGQLDAVHGRFRRVAITRDELRQAMRERLFVAAEGAAPRIASYQGRGGLGAWLRMAATRYLLDVVRAESARPAITSRSGDEQLAELATAGDDPELAFLKRQYREHFRAAFAEAMGALPPRARNILRHRYLDGLEVAELATIYGLHRVTMSRTLTQLREDLLASIRQAFLRRLGIGAEELDQIMTLIASQLELSLSRLLR